MDDLKNAFSAKGLEVPEGLVSLIETAKNRRVVYHRLWAAAKFGAKIGTSHRTYVFPIEVREAVRDRFRDVSAGAYDEQFDQRADVYYVSIEEMAKLPYPKAKK